MLALMRYYAQKVDDSCDVLSCCTVQQQRSNEGATFVSDCHDMMIILRKVSHLFSTGASLACEPAAGMQQQCYQSNIC